MKLLKKKFLLFALGTLLLAPFTTSSLVISKVSAEEMLETREESRDVLALQSYLYLASDG